MDSRIKVNLLRATFLVSIAIVLQVTVDTLKIPSYLLPAPRAIISEYFRLGELIGQSALVTAIEALTGLAIASVVGTLIGVTFFYSRSMRVSFYPLIAGFQGVPKSIFAPLFVIWLGLGIESKIVYTFLICFFPFVVNVLSGLANIDREIIHLVQALSATERQIFTKVRLPFMLSHFFDALKISVPLSFIGAVIGEFVGSTQGLGYLTFSALNDLNGSLIIGVAVLLGILSMAMFGAVIVVERRILRWKYAAASIITR